MKYKKAFIGVIALISFACNENRNPYDNKLGIESSVLAEMDTANYTLMQWKDTLLNFGVIKPGDSVRLKYEFTNVGKTALFILNTRTTCGCTVTDFPKEPIMPRKSGFISVKYQSNSETGDVNKKVIVITNTKNKRYSNLFFHGSVQSADKKN